MGKHIAEGKAFPLFFYGQNYMGTIEQFTLGTFFKLFGFHPIGLRLVPLFYFILCVFIFYILSKNHFYPKQYLYPLIFLVFPTLYSIIWTLKARGGFIEIVLLCLSFLYLILLYKKEGKNWQIYLSAFIAGFAIYTNTLCLPFLLIVSLISYLSTNKVKTNAKTISISIFSFLLGISPIIIASINTSKNYGVSFGLNMNLSSKAHIIISEIIPLFLGITIPDEVQWSFSSIGKMVLSLLTLIAILITLYKYRTYIWGLIRLKKLDYPIPFYLIITLPIYFLVLLVSPYLQDVKGIRYLILGIFITPIFLTELLLIFQHKPIIRNTLIAIILFAGFLSAYEFLNTTQHKHSPSWEILIDHGNDTRTLVSFLDKHTLQYGYADYWVQGNINYLSAEKLTYAAFDRNRYLPYKETVDKFDFPTYIYLEKKLQDVKKELNQIQQKHHKTYQLKSIGDYIILYPI